MLTHLVQGLTTLGNGPDIGYLFAGALIGMIVGVIPGLGGAVVLSIILIFVYHLNLTATLCLFLGAHAGSYYSASVTSILLNTPAHPEAFAVTFDGYPMASKGEPGRALGISACSTCVGGFVGCGVLIGFLQIINYLPGMFHPPEYVALVALAMFMVGTLGTNSMAKAVIAAGAGLMVASVGPSNLTGTFRYTFNALGLYSGVSLVALALGVFAIPQMAMVFGTGTVIARQDMTGKDLAPATPVDLSSGFSRQLIGGVLETFRHWVVLLQGGLTGALTGIVPGVGGFAANFLSYGIAQQTSKKRALFGTGIPEGIIAPEGASLAKEAGSMIPILGLGIPGGVGGALFLAALSIKGIHTGYGFMSAYPNLGYEIVWIIALGGLIGTIAGVLVGPHLAKVTRVPGALLFPFIISLSIIGPFLVDVSFFAVMEVLIFGLIGFALRRLRFPLASFILGLVLGPTLETNIYLTRNIYPGATFIEKRPLADVLFVIAIFVLIAKAVEVRRESNALKTALAGELSHLTDPTQRAEVVREQHHRNAPYPLLAPIMTLFLLSVSLFFIIYGITNFNRVTATMPVIGATLVAIPALVLLPRDIHRYVLYRRAKHVTSIGLAQDSLNVPEHELVSARTIDSAEAAYVPDSSDLMAALRPSPLMSPDDYSVIHDKSWGRNGQYTREVIALAWVAFVIGACWIFGFLWGIPLFVAAYGLTSTGRFLATWNRRIIFTVLSTACMWGVVDRAYNALHLVFTPVVHL